MKFIGAHVNGRTKCAGTIGGSAYAALHLYRVHRGSKIGQVNEIRALAFCIVVRDTVQRYINARCIRTLTLMPV